jgi:hypothetical protein
MIYLVLIYDVTGLRTFTIFYNFTRSKSYDIKINRLRYYLHRKKKVEDVLVCCSTLRLNLLKF